jgi:dTDP-4-amino-4,6-dideoxygalactose transaminase
VIPITKSYLPNIEEYTSHVNRAFKNNWLTNRGELVLELEKNLKTFLKITESNLLCLNNGTSPIQIALKLLGKGGEIITTPFSYVATTAAIVWENCTPVFIDIHKDQLTIDETKIEAGITEKTTCILATHVYGNPCNIEAIEKISKKHNLKVIYDAAHCFNVEYKGKSIFEYGDVSTCSFHSTKIFHTGEGGALFCNNKQLFDKLFYNHNFGHNGPTEYHGLGINAKMSELSAAMGLSVLPHFEKIFNGRKLAVEIYNQNLAFSNVQLLNIRKDTDWNYSYYPLVFKSEAELLEIKNILEKENIFPRRYFFPALHKLPYIKNIVELPIAESVSKRVLCLPLYYNIDLKVVVKICGLINKHLLVEK